MNVVAIPAYGVPGIWPDIQPGIEKMLAKGIGTHTADEIYLKAAAGEWLLFLVEDEGQPVVTIICSITQGDRKVFEIGMAWGGRMAEWIDEIDEVLTRVAKELGCDSMAIAGRRGWVKTLADRGFTEKMVTVVREL